MPSLEDQILIAIRRISRAIDLRSRDLLQHYGLTAPQLAIMSVIARLQPVTAGRIASEVHLGQPTVTGVLNRLEARALIERVRGNQDRRSVNVSLTPEGVRVLQTAPSLLEEQFVKKLGELHEWERTQMLSTLQRIAEMMHVSRVESGVNPIVPLDAQQPASAWITEAADSHRHSSPDYEPLLPESLTGDSLQTETGTLPAP